MYRPGEIVMSIERSAKEARRLGYKRYFTNKPCKRGHVAERWVCDSSCIKCRVIDTADWVTINSEKVLLARKKWYAKNPSARLLVNKKWRDANPEKVREINRANVKAWTKINLAKKYATNAKRRAIKMNAKGSHTAEEVSILRAQQNDCCNNVSCKIPLFGKGHLDHIISLSKGGSNFISNLQWLCVSCNTSKGARDPFEFAIHSMSKIGSSCNTTNPVKSY